MIDLIFDREEKTEAINGIKKRVAIFQTGGIMHAPASPYAIPRYTEYKPIFDLPNEIPAPTVDKSKTKPNTYKPDKINYIKKYKAYAKLRNDSLDATAAKMQQAIENDDPATFKALSKELLRHSIVWGGQVEMIEKDVRQINNNLKSDQVLGNDKFVYIYNDKTKDFVDVDYTSYAANKDKLEKKGYRVMKRPDIEDVLNFGISNEQDVSKMLKLLADMGKLNSNDVIQAKIAKMTKTGSPFRELIKDKNGKILMKVRNGVVDFSNAVDSDNNKSMLYGRNNYIAFSSNNDELNNLTAEVYNDFSNDLVNFKLKAANNFDVILFKTIQNLGSVDKIKKYFKAYNIDITDEDANKIQSEILSKKPNVSRVNDILKSNKKYLQGYGALINTVINTNAFADFLNVSFLKNFKYDFNKISYSAPGKKDITPKTETKIGLTAIKPIVSSQNAYRKLEENIRRAYPNKEIAEVLNGFISKLKDDRTMDATSAKVLQMLDGDAAAQESFRNANDKSRWIANASITDVVNTNNVYSVLLSSNEEDNEVETELKKESDVVFVNKKTFESGIDKDDAKNVYYLPGHSVFDGSIVDVTGKPLSLSDTFKINRMVDDLVRKNVTVSQRDSMFGTKAIPEGSKNALWRIVGYMQMSRKSGIGKEKTLENVKNLVENCDALNTTTKKGILNNLKDAYKYSNTTSVRDWGFGKVTEMNVMKKRVIRKVTKEEAEDIINGDNKFRYINADVLSILNKDPEKNKELINRIYTNDNLKPGTIISKNSVGSGALPTWMPFSQNGYNADENDVYVYDWVYMPLKYQRTSFKSGTGTATQSATDEATDYFNKITKKDPIDVPFDILSKKISNDCSQLIKP